MEKFTIVLSLISTIIISVITLFGQPFLNFYNIRRTRKLKSLINTNEINEVIKKCEGNFETNFIIPEIKESYFYAKTGIQTHHETIKKYIKLKNDLGLNYSWKSIKSASSFIRVDKENAYILITKGEKIFFKFLISFSLGLFFIPTFLLMASSHLNSFKELPKTDRMVVSFSGILIMIFGFMLLWFSTSYLQANHIKKRLDIIQEQTENEIK